VIRLGAVLEDMRAARVGDRRQFVHVDCVSRRTKTQWTHLVREESADDTVRSIERRRPDVRATVRR